MEGNLSSGSMMPGNASFGGLDLPGSVRVHHNQHPFSLQQHHQSHNRHGSMVHQTIHENFPLTIGRMQENDHSVSLADFSKGDKVKCVSDEDEPSHTEDAADGSNNGGKGKKPFPWHRVKWTDAMVRLLITAVSYIGEETAAEYGSGARRKCTNLQKKGKWKSVSKVMAERSHFVSPQQCEDKFNDLNKRYKRLNEILGRGTSCQVVEKPGLLDTMDHVSEKAKEEVRKILSSKHLHYEEMCSYHNGNRLHLPPDPELQRSLRLALRSRDDPDENNTKRNSQDDDEDDQDVELYDNDDYEDDHALHGERMTFGIPGGSSKRVKQSQGHEDICFANSLNPLDCNRSLNFPSPSAPADENQLISEGIRSNILQKQWISHHFLQLEEQKLIIQAQMLELEKERFKWQKFSRKKDRELEMMKIENERMKLQNERMALELKRKEMSVENS